MSYIYYTILIPTLLCTQCLAHISAILSIRNIPIAMLISQVILNMMAQLCNGLMPVKAMSYSIQMLSELSFLRLTHDFIILNMYGLNRCDTNQTSVVLNIFDINDDMFWLIIIKMIIHIVVLKILSFVIFIIKFNQNFHQISYPFYLIYHQFHNYLPKSKARISENT